MATKDLRINRQIRAKEVFVIDANGNQKGIMSVPDAVRFAEEEGLDLVEVSPPQILRSAGFWITGNTVTNRRNDSAT